MRKDQPILTIAIPTWNRSSYLRQNLEQLRSELDVVGHNYVEVIVSDNCSTDGTEGVVNESILEGFKITYIRNETNLGWARNFLQCIEISSGKYILLLGDDDVICDGLLSSLMPLLIRNNYGVICMRPFGYDSDFLKEKPGGDAKIRVYKDSKEFLIAISQFFTLTSALIINREYLNNKVDIRQFIHTNLVTFHLVLRASLAAEENVFLDQFVIASKRQNSFSYEYYKVFVDEFWEIIDAHKIYGLSFECAKKLETRHLFSYYPFYMFDLRASARGDIDRTFKALKRRFKHRPMFWLWIAPTLKLPKPFALTWGAVTTFIGRIYAGDFRRGLKFFRDRLSRVNFIL